MLRLNGFYSLIGSAVAPAEGSPCAVTTFTIIFVVSLVAVGQVITRLQLTWKGRQTNSVAEAKGAFRWLLCFVLGYWVLRAFMLYIIANLDPNAKFDGSDIDMTQYKEPPKLYYFCCFLDDIFWYSYFAFSVWILRNVRYVISPFWTFDFVLLAIRCVRC